MFIWLLGFVSCLSGIKTEDIRKTIVANVNMANVNQTKINKDFKDKLDAYQWLEGYIINKDLEPFKSITKHKNEMSKTHEALRLKTDQIKALQFMNFYTLLFRAMTQWH